MNHIGECCGGGQMPMPKMDVKHPTYMAIMSNSTMDHAKMENERMSKEQARMNKMMNQNE